MTDALKTIESLKAKQAERQSLIEQLELWALVQAQGIAIDTVASFGFDPVFLTEKQKREARRAALYGRPHLFSGERLACGKYRCVVYNFVRHHDGSQTVLDPMLKAPQ